MNAYKKTSNLFQNKKTLIVSNCVDRERFHIANGVFFSAYINYSTELKFRYDYKF